MQDVQQVDNLDDRREIVILFSHLNFDQIQSYFDWLVTNMPVPIGTERKMHPGWRGNPNLSHAAYLDWGHLMVAHDIDKINLAKALAELAERARTVGKRNPE